MNLKNNSRSMLRIVLHKNRIIPGLPPIWQGQTIKLGRPNTLKYGRNCKKDNKDSKGSSCYWTIQVSIFAKYLRNLNVHLWSPESEQFYLEEINLYTFIKYYNLLFSQVTLITLLVWVSLLLSYWIPGGS